MSDDDCDGGDDCSLPWSDRCSHTPSKSQVPQHSVTALTLPCLKSLLVCASCGSISC